MSFRLQLRDWLSASRVPTRLPCPMNRKPNCRSAGRAIQGTGPVSGPKPGIVMAEDIMALLDETDLVVMKPGRVLFRKGELDAPCTSSSRARCRSFVSNHMRVGESSIGLHMISSRTLRAPWS
jgi:hypothetical protein